MAVVLAVVNGRLLLGRAADDQLEGEIRELIAKLATGERVDFDLDIAQMLPAEEFEVRMREAVPGDYD